MRISVLGPLRVLAGQEIHQRFESNKVRGLFAYLVVEMQKQHHRETLADLFWPEHTTRYGLANLRYALADLRKVIGDNTAKPPYLIISRESLQFNMSCNFELDIAEFEYLSKANDIEDLKSAIALYRGDFLEGFPYLGSDLFEEWLNFKREEYKVQAIELLQVITNHHALRGEYQQAFPFVRKQLELQPWLEEAHQQLMRLLAFDGQRSAAMAQFETCRQTLAYELNIEPAQETIQVYEAIRDGRIEKTPGPFKREPPAPGYPPFKGLQYFEVTDTDLFFGREALISYLVNQINARQKRDGTRFLAIIGASGSGKSSLVRAGLIPALMRSGMSKFVVITPTENPVETLNSEIKKLNTAKGHILLFVDQFEELFTLCPSKTEQTDFINDLLHYLVEGSVFVVIALRADFYAACAPFENLRKILSQNQDYIGPMNSAELRRAIEEPARMNGWYFEPGLVDLLLHDIGAEGDRSPEPGALPLLSHALLETWNRRSGQMLTLAGYGESGRIHQAIAKSAETVFERLSPEEQVVARNIFLRLTGLREGIPESRRRVQLKELVSSPVTASFLRGTTETVLKMLSDARLVITTEETVEVAHEALIREWNRLQEWLTENREALRLHRHLTEAALEWSNQGRDQELVYRGSRLSKSLEWAESHPDDLNILEREFLEASKSIADHEFAEREAQRMRELEAAHKLAASERQRAEEQTRSAQSLRRRAYYLLGILVLLLILAVTAFAQRNMANRQSHVASARELALASINNLNVDAELSILLALQAVHESELADIPVPTEVRDALHRAIQNSRIHYTIADHTSEVNAVAYSPDGKLLATASSDRTARVWDAITGEALFTLDGHTQIVEDVVFSPNGKILVTTGDDRSVKLWDVNTGKEIRTLTGHSDKIWQVTFNADGTLLASGGSEMTKVWDVSTGKLLTTLNGQHAPIAFSPILEELVTVGDDESTTIWNVDTWEEMLSLPYLANALAFSPDGKYLATAMSELKIWNALTGEELLTETGFSGPVTGIGYSPDGSKIATGGQDGSAIIWDVEIGTRLFSLAGHTGAVNDVAFNPMCVSPPEFIFEWCGVWLATAGRDGTAKVWDVSPSGSRELATLPGFSGSFLDETHLFTTKFLNLNDIEIQTWEYDNGKGIQWVSSTIFKGDAPIMIGGISSNGMYLVTADINNAVRTWDLQTGRVLSEFLVEEPEMVFYIAISPDASRVVTGGDSPNVSLWDTGSGTGLLTLTGSTDIVSGMALSPDGHHLVTGYADGTVILWDIATGEKELSLSGHNLPVYVMAFAPGRNLIATAGMDQATRVWNTTSGENLINLTGHNASVIAMTFSPDGSLLMTGSHDASARIWDLSDETTDDQEYLTLTGHFGYIDSIFFSPDGELVATGSFQDETVRVYILNDMDVATLAKQRLTRSFTLEECQKYLHLDSCPNQP